MAGSRSSSPQNGPSTFPDNVDLRAELIHLHNLKQQLDEECHVLRHQKEVLVQDILEIQTGKSYYQNGGAGIPVSVNMTLQFSCHDTVQLFKSYVEVAGHSGRRDRQSLQQFGLHIFVLIAVSTH